MAIEFNGGKIKLNWATSVSTEYILPFWDFIVTLKTEKVSTSFVYIFDISHWQISSLSPTQQRVWIPTFWAVATPVPWDGVKSSVEYVQPALRIGLQPSRVWLPMTFPSKSVKLVGVPPINVIEEKGAVCGNISHSVSICTSIKAFSASDFKCTSCPVSLKVTSLTKMFSSSFSSKIFCNLDLSHINIGIDSWVDFVPVSFCNVAKVPQTYWFWYFC